MLWEPDVEKLESADAVAAASGREEFCVREILSKRDSGLPSILKGCRVNLGG